MPYYKDRLPLAPPKSDVITFERVERLLNIAVMGFSSGLSGVSFQMREHAVEDYQGFYVARSIQFSDLAEQGPTYVIALVDGQIDGRLQNFKERKSPWAEKRDSPPTLADIEQCWQPLDDPDMLRKAEQIFLQVERHAQDNQYSDLTDEQRLQEVRREEVDIKSLAEFCTVLGRETRETAAWIEDHVAFAAFNPHNYLKTTGRLKNMTLDACRHFNWRKLVIGGDSHFHRKGYVDYLDWKGTADDTAFCINNILKVVSPGMPRSISLEGDNINFHTDYWLEKASVELRKLGFLIVLIDDAGDGFVLTVIEKRQAQPFVELGRKIGLDTQLFPADEPEPQGWMARLRSIFTGGPSGSASIPTPVEKPAVQPIEPLAVDPETLRKRQNDWMKDRFREWQLAWHDIFDGDVTLEAKGEFDRPDPIPDTIDRDYRLVLGLVHAEAETRKRCFALLANGEEMHRRFDLFVREPLRSMPEAEARALVAELGRHVDDADPDEKIDWTRITIVDRNAPDARETLSRCGCIADLLSESLLEPTPDAELPTLAARLFLTEPLYASAGNFYELRDWVTAAGSDPRRDKVHELAYRLWNSGWQPLVSMDGVVLARRR